MLKDKSVLKDKKFYGAAHNWRLEFVALDFAINQKHKNIFLSTFYIMAENKYKLVNVFKSKTQAYNTLYFRYKNSRINKVCKDLNLY